MIMCHFLEPCILTLFLFHEKNHNFDRFLQSMAPGAAGDDKSKEEEKKVSNQKVSKLDKIDNFAGQEVASQQFRQQWRRKEGEGEEQVQGEGIFPLGVAVIVSRSRSCSMFYSCYQAVIR